MDELCGLIFEILTGEEKHEQEIWCWILARNNGRWELEDARGFKDPDLLRALGLLRGQDAAAPSSWRPADPSPPPRRSSGRYIGGWSVKARRYYAGKVEATAGLRGEGKQK